MLWRSVKQPLEKIDGCRAQIIIFIVYLFSTNVFDECLLERTSKGHLSS